MVTSSLESFSVPDSGAKNSSSSDMLRNEVFETKLASGNFSDSASLVGSSAPSEVLPPAGMDAGAWAQISEMVESGKDIRFSTASDGVVPDFIMAEDGSLALNPEKEPSADGSITIQVDNKGGDAAAKKAAQQYEVAKIQLQIFYWQKANPGSDSVPHYLQSMLASAQSNAAVEPAPSDSRPAAPAASQNAPAAGRQIEPAASTPRASTAGPVGGGGSRSAGGAPYSVGGRSIGPAPEGGHRRGSFEPLHPINRDAIPRPIEGDVAIKGPPSANVEQIQKFLEDIGSPAAREAGFSQALYDATTERGIDPAVAVGFFLQESTCGRYGRARENLSMGNIKGVAPESGGTDGTFRRYDSWAEGARDWARLIDEQYVQKRGLTSLSQVIGVYAPSSDGNNESKYVSTVNGVVQNFQKMNNGNAVA